jgi:hypothetical protein
MDGFWLDSNMMVGQWELCCNIAACGGGCTELGKPGPSEVSSAFTNL